MHKKTEMIFSILLVAISVFFAPMNNATASATETKLSVEPQRIVDPTLGPGEVFTIGITIANVADLYSFELKLSFNSTILSATNVELGDFFPSPEQVAIMEPPWINNTAGHIHFGAEIVGCELPRSGNGTLLVITFQVISIGYCELVLSESYVTDFKNNTIPHETFHGYFNNLSIGKRDVAVINVTPSHTEAYAGWIVNVTVTAINRGDLTETFDVNAFYDNSSIGTITVIDLAFDEQAILTFSWNTENVQPSVNFTIRAEATLVPNEINVTNNVFINGVVRIKMLGDVNGDGVVDIFDVVETALAFGSYPGHPRWNPDADLRPDDTIDIFDLVLVALLDPL